MADTDTPTSALLDSTVVDQLNNPEARSLIDTIDSLRELQVGEIVNLPQIIVVGDQSCGKSSVLEAISRVRFPAKGDLCTRFATELILRRSPVSNVEVSIQFAEPRQSEHAESFSESGFDRDALPEIISAAKERMGIVNEAGKGFSKDILRVEVSGPEVYPLTLVDLPGYFHNATADQSLEDARIVKDLVSSYMKQPNTIILAVVAANNQLANQVVLERAARYDPRKERTLGVITKPDLLKAGNANEQKYIQLAKGLESLHQLKLGWHVLRNRSEGDEDTANDQRDADEENFFAAHGAWGKLSPSQRGIESLRKRLSKVLLDHIQQSLPSLIGDIEAGLHARQESLDRLGKERATVADIRSYLLGIAVEFSRLANDAVQGRFNEAFFGDIDADELKLRAKIRAYNDAFDYALFCKGHRYNIERKRLDTDPEPDIIDDEPPASDLRRPFMKAYAFPEPEEISESDLNDQLEEMSFKNQGKEFPGMPKQEIVTQLFKIQSEPWKRIAERHLTLVTDNCKLFVEQLFAHIVGGDAQTMSAILHFCVDRFFAARRDMLAIKLNELLRPYKELDVVPSKRRFENARRNYDINRLTSDLIGSILEDPYEEQTVTAEDIREAVYGNARRSASEYGNGTVIDNMMRYYSVSDLTPGPLAILGCVEV
jgi:GTP-binding protein EngB required for normal cell division